MEKADNTKELELNFPAKWQYKIIMQKEHDAKKIIKEVLKDRNFEIKKSQNSSKGNFTSHSLETTVNSNEDRKALYGALKQHKNIKFVL